MKNDTNFGSESVQDIRCIQVGNKDVYQRKVMVNGNTQWIDVKTAVEEIDTHEFEPHTDISQKKPSSISERFQGTSFKPQDLKGVKTDPLIKKELEDLKAILVDKELLANYMDRLIKMHAILIRIIGASPETILAGHHTQIDKLKKNSALREAVLLFIDVVGDPWTQVKHLI